MQISRNGMLDDFIPCLWNGLCCLADRFCPLSGSFMCMWGDECLGRADVQLKLLDIFYKKKNSPPTQIL